MTGNEVSPPRRSRTRLQEWVKEFEAQGPCIAGSISVPPQEDTDGQDTGLVVVRLSNSAASVYMQPRGYDEPLWEATLTAQHDELALTPQSLASLAAELVVAGNLCSFLQWKSLEWDRESGRHPETSFDAPAA